MRITNLKEMLKKIGHEMPKLQTETEREARIALLRRQADFIKESERKAREK